MADTGWKSPTATGGTHNQWFEPTDAYSSNNTYATLISGLFAGDEKQSYEEFSFGIGSEDTINGIEASLEWKYTNNAPANHLLKWYSTSDVTDSDGKEVPISTIEATETVGGSEDLWGRTPIGSDFSNANFSIWVIGKSGFEQVTKFWLDHIQVKVYYTEAAAEDTGNMFMLF